VLAAPLGARVIYGEDGRKEVYQAKDVYKMLARSTPSMVPKSKMISSSSIFHLDLEQTSFSAWLNEDKSNKSLEAMSEVNGALSFCPTERFTEQPIPAICSGFLIAPDLVVTAGHCAQVENSCEDFNWVFDFKVDPETGTAGLNIKPENVYSCKRIVSAALNMEIGADYAVIELDRKVVGRQPLTLSAGGKIDFGTGLVVIGNPSGLPLKVTEGGAVRENSELLYFSANLDTYQGNSGSVVLNAVTNEVEGILVRGEQDFTLNQNLGCVQSNHCADDSCRGESVSRIQSIPEVALSRLLYKAASLGNAEIIQKILDLKIWVDFNLKDGETALMKAASTQKNAAVLALLSNGAEVNKSDAKGNTALHHLARTLDFRGAPVLHNLILANGDLSARNNKGQTPFMVAKEALNLQGMGMLFISGK